MKKKVLGLMVAFLAAVPVFVNAEGNAVKIGEEEFATLKDAVLEAKACNEEACATKITVVADHESEGIVFERGKYITIDFGGHTVTFTSEVGDTNPKRLNMQLLNGSTLVFKNGTLKPSKEAKMLVQNYTNLTLENMTLDGRNEIMTYTLSNNSGDVNIIGETNIYAPEGKVAFDVCGYATYTIGPKVVINTTGTIEGKIEVTKDATAANERPLSLVIKNINHNGGMSIQEGLENNITIEGGNYTDKDTAEKLPVEEGSNVYQVVTTEGENKYIVAEESKVEEGYFGLGFERETLEAIDDEELKETLNLVDKTLADKYTAAIYYEIVYGDLIDDKFILGTEVSKLDKAIEITLDIPETIEKLKEGYTRNYKVIRVHYNEDTKEFETDILNVKSVKEGKVTFETDKFSTYVLAYEDVEITSNPKTFDGISLYIAIASISLIGLVSLVIYTKKAKNY